MFTLHMSYENLSGYSQGMKAYGYMKIPVAIPPVALFIITTYRNY